MEEEREFLKPIEAAKILNVSISTLNRWAAEKHGPQRFNIGRRVVRYRRVDVLRFIEQQPA